MRVRTLISPLLLSLVLSVPVFLIPTTSSALCGIPGYPPCCCGCGKCWMKQYTNPPCYCPGENGCPTCYSDDSDAVQSNAFPDNSMAVTTSSIPEGLMSAIAQADVSEGVMNLMSGGKCFREKVALSLLGNTRESLKFVPVRFDEKNAQDQTLAF